MIVDSHAPVDLYALLPELRLRMEPELAELDVLLEDRSNPDWYYPATCPHGRSICYRLDHKEIARRLDRR